MDTTGAKLGIFAHFMSMSVRFAISRTLHVSVRARFRISSDALKATRAPVGICAYFNSMSARFVISKTL